MTQDKDVLAMHAALPESTKLVVEEEGSALCNRRMSLLSWVVGASWKHEPGVACL